MKVIHQQEIETVSVQRVWNVSEFCRRFRLDRLEEKRLRLLLGEFANQQELLMNARRKPDLR